MGSSWQRLAQEIHLRHARRDLGGLLPLVQDLNARGWTTKSLDDREGRHQAGSVRLGPAFRPTVSCWLSLDGSVSI